MSRIALIQPELASPEVKEIYEKTLRGKPGNFHKILANRPEILKVFLPFYSSVGRTLDRKLYELIYIRVSMINQCQYCLQHHLSSSKRAGLTPDDWAALKNTDYGRFTEKEQAAVHYAEKLTKVPHEVNDTDLATLKKYFSDAEIVDVNMLAALANLTNRLTDPLGAEVEFAPQKI